MNYCYFLLSALLFSGFFLPFSSELEQNPYSYLSYSSIINYFEEFAQNHSNYIKLHDVRKEHPDIPSAECGSNECIHYYAQITNFTKGEEYVNQLPQIFLIGSLHGNEPLGSNILTYLTKLLLEQKDEFSEISEIINNKMIVILPMANPSGYYYQKREEGYLDPNRDFPYNVKNDECLQTTAAKVVNAIVKEHLFVSSITFHGGETSLTYPWGGYNHENDLECPDKAAFVQVGEIMVNEAGKNDKLSVKKYELGDLNHVVYPVNGGLEDWIYAGSWENNTIPKCNSVENASLANSSIYNSEQVKVLIYLAEASDNKKPPDYQLGNEWGVFYNDEVGQFGHITRNIRLSLTLADLTAPYIIFLKAENTREGIKVEWQVKGCFMVNFTRLSWSNEFDFSNSMFGKTLDGPGYWNNKTFVFSDFVVSNNTDFNSIYISASATCDLQLGNQIKPAPKVEPQTHYVKMRTDSHYNVENENFTLNSYNNFTKILDIPITTFQEVVYSYSDNMMLCPISLLKEVPKISFQIKEIELSTYYNVEATLENFSYDESSNSSLWKIVFFRSGNIFNCSSETMGEMFNIPLLNLQKIGDSIWSSTARIEISQIDINEIYWGSAALVYDNLIEAAIILKYEKKNIIISGGACYISEIDYYNFTAHLAEDEKIYLELNVKDGVTIENETSFEIITFSNNKTIVSAIIENNGINSIINNQNSVKLMYGDELIINYVTPNEKKSHSCIITKDFWAYYPLLDDCVNCTYITHDHLWLILVLGMVAFFFISLFVCWFIMKKCYSNEPLKNNGFTTSFGESSQLDLASSFQSIN